MSLRNALKTGIPAWALPLARKAYHFVYRTQLQARFIWSDSFSTKNHSLPPARLRFRVSETLDPDSFIAVGRNAAQNLRRALSSSGRQIADSWQILEFGCGCGRVIVPLKEAFPHAHFFGTDVNQEAIDWCRAHLPNIDFGANQELPPLTYQSAKFDLVYCISVFTHLDDAHARAWLHELKRILKPGGVLLLTVHGEHVSRNLPMEQRERLEKQGYLFETTAKLSGIQPAWYQTSYHARHYILDMVGKDFRVITHTPQGMGYQDLIIAERL